MRACRSLAPLSLVALLLSGCGRGPVSVPAEAPSLSGAGMATCKVASSQSRPLVVEWPAADRAGLETLARSGLVAVRYSGCEMEILRQCKVKGGYAYTPITPKHDSLRLKDENDLYAALPLGAARFEGKLAQAGELNVSMTVVGTLDTKVDTVTADDLSGDCKQATHVVAGMAIGAFDFYAGAQTEVGAGVDVQIGAAKASARSGREQLMSDGEQQSCSRASRGDSVPPDGCSAVIRLEVVPLGARRASEPLPSIDLGEVVYQPHVTKPGAVYDVSSKHVDDALLLEGLKGPAAAAVSAQAATNRALGAQRKAFFELVEKLRECQRAGCSAESKLVADQKALSAKIRAAEAKLAAEQERALKALGPEMGKDPSAAAALADGVLRRAQLFAVIDDPAKRDQVYRRMAGSLRAAERKAEKDSALAWWADYELGTFAQDVGDYATAIEAWRALLAMAPRPGTAEVALRAGDVLQEQGKAGEAIDAYRKGIDQTRADDASPYLLRPILQLALIKLTRSERRHRECVDESLTFLDDIEARAKKNRREPWAEVRPELVAIAATCVEGLGGVEKEGLRSASPSTLARVGLQLASNALERDDLLGATRAWALVAARAPGTLEAATAWAALAAARDELGDEAGAREARGKLDGYTLSSPWADQLRKGRDADGEPSEQTLRRVLGAAPPRLPARPTTPEARRGEAQARLLRVVRACVGDEPPPTAPLEVTLRVIEGKPPTVEGTGSADALACVRREAGAYFVGASNSLHARVSFAKP